MLVLLVAAALLAPLIAPYNPEATTGPIMAPPSLRHPLGTTAFGQDVLSQLLYATRTSLYVGLVGGGIGTLIALAIGLASGYVGGAVDFVLNGLTNVFLVIPSFFILVLVGAFAKFRSITVEALLIGAFMWPGAARSMRSIALSAKARDYVSVARLSGEGALEVMFLEIMPQSMAYVMLTFIGMYVWSITSEVMLDLLGLAPAHVLSLGMMLYEAWSYNALISGAWWWILSPAAVLVLLGSSMLSIDFALDKVFNPRLRE